MTTVMIAGGFDPLHSGHLDHIQRASALALMDKAGCPAECEHRRKIG